MKPSPYDEMKQSLLEQCPPEDREDLLTRLSEYEAMDQQTIIGHLEELGATMTSAIVKASVLRMLLDEQSRQSIPVEECDA